MTVGLFDLYTSGHHLPYAARLQRAIESDSDIDVKFITLSEVPRCQELFDDSDVLYLDDPTSPRLEDRDGTFDEISERAIEEFLSSEATYEFDILHFLFADDILGSLYRHSGNADKTRLVAELNGAFFQRKLPLRQGYSHTLFFTLLQSPVAGIIDSLVPTRTDHEQLWRDLFLYRCLREGTFDYLIAHSYEAYEYVIELVSNPALSVKQVPYPAPTNFGSEVTQQAARQKLNLPLEDSLLLFFGTLHKKKGINNLIDILRRYDGPTFTMLIAGPPVDVTEEEICALQDTSNINIIPELGYIDTPEFYYRAADAMILPYTREFGRECTSQTLTEACGAFLPVIVPDFGAVGRVTKEWNLGMTYKQGSDQSLRVALEKFARNGVSYSEEQMRQYTRSHSYKQAAAELLSVYRA